MADFISHFLKSDWLKKASQYAYNPRRLKAIVFQLGLFLSRKGISRLREQVQLMYFYLHDIAIDKYKEYNVSSLAFIIASAIYLISPIDFIPDILPSGLIDDSAIIIWALNVSSDELKRYKNIKRCECRVM